MDIKQSQQQQPSYITIDCLQNFDEKLINIPTNIILLKNSQDVNQSQIVNLIEIIKRTLLERYKIKPDDVYFIFRDIGITTKLLKNPVKIFKPYSNEIQLEFFIGALFTINSVYNFTPEDNNIELKNYITLVTGENYSGKSSCIDAIFALFTGSGAIKSPNSIKQGFIKAQQLNVQHNHTFIKNIKNSKECLIITDDNQQPLPSKKFHETLAAKFKYMYYLKKIYTFDITKNINKFISKTFFEEKDEKDVKDEKNLSFQVTAKQLESITIFYENLINIQEANNETKQLIKKEFDKFFVKEKEEEKIDEMFIKTLETFINKILNELNFSFYINIHEGKLTVHNLYINKTSIDKPIKISDASTMQQNIISLIFKSSLLKLWTISCTGDIQSKFPIYFIDETLDGFTLDQGILLNLIKRTEKWFHRIIIVSNSTSVINLIKSSFNCGHYEVVKPKLIKSLENSNNGSGSYIKSFDEKSTAPIPKPSALEEKFIQESFIPHAMYGNILINTITDQFKCNKCGKIMQMTKLAKHVEQC
jgi:hypothetical protein